MLYTAFGMQIRSEIRLHLPAVDTAGRTFENAAGMKPWPVDIVCGTIPPDSAELPHAIGTIRYGMSAARGADGAWIRIDVPRVARYQIQGVSRIIVAPEAGADDQRIGLYISGLVLAFMLKQLPFITLHGSAVVKDGKAVVFIGEQGSGKSTAAAAMTTVGYRVLCDDIIPIADGPLVMPGVAQVKLLPDAFERMVGNPDNAAHLFDGVDKFQADLGGTFRPAPLQVIIVLEPPGDYANKTGLVLAEPVTGMDKIRLLLQHMTSIKALDDASEQFLRLTKLLGLAPVFRLVRPARGCDMAKIIARIITREKPEEVFNEIC
jgi:hypothetical protein